MAGIFPRKARDKDHLAICDRTGFTVWNSEMRDEWNGLRVRRKSWEARHPQEIAKVVVDKQVVPKPRPGGAEGVYGPLWTTLTNTASPGQTALTVGSTTRWVAGDKLSIILANDDAFLTDLQSVDSSTTITINPGLPSKAEAGAVLVNISSTGTPSV